ncbi:MAG: histidine phosphatase family protein [Bacilli bacterium]|jgi:broad specificity phosphatase PhoE|nr:histidine phosphatase family protein [Bacilli bacterium]
MKLYLIRHGITEGNKKTIYNGRKDEKLSQEGILDLEKKRVLYKDLAIDYSYCSTLTRAKQSFEVLFPNQKVDEYRDDLVEMDFGDWTGMNYHDKFKELFAKGYTFNDLVDPDNGETYDELFLRTTNFLNEVLNKHKNKKCVVVLTHGLVISSLMFKHFNTNHNMYELSPDNGLGYIIEFNSKKQVKNIEKIAF